MANFAQVSLLAIRVKDAGDEPASTVTISASLTTAATVSRIAPSPTPAHASRAR